MSDFSANITGVEEVSVCYWTILTVLIAVIVVVVTTVAICHQEATKRYQMRQEAERQERFARQEAERQERIARQEAERLRVLALMIQCSAVAEVAMHEATMMF